MKKRIFSVVMAGILISGMGVQVFAEPTEEEQQAIDLGKENLTKAEREFLDAERKVNEANSDIEVAQAEINGLGNKAKILQKDIDNADAEIDVLKGDIEVKEKELGGRLNTIYKAGGTNSYLQILLSADSISDFFGRVKAINSILDLDKSALDELNSKKDQLNRRVEKLQKDKADLVNVEKENKKKIEEQSKKKVELEKAYKEYEKIKQSADFDLAKYEKSIYKYWEDLINNSKSTKGDLQQAITTLTSLKGEVTSNEAKKDIDNLINKAKNDIKKKDEANSAAGKASKVIGYAMAQIGKPYGWGMAGPNSFDCSGLVVASFRQVGIAVGRTTYAQASAGRGVSISELQPGDIILCNASASGPEHVVIYIGNGRVVHAPRTGTTIRTESLSSFRFYSARRLL